MELESKSTEEEEIDEDKVQYVKEAKYDPCDDFKKVKKMMRHLAKSTGSDGLQFYTYNYYEMQRTFAKVQRKRGKIDKIDFDYNNVRDDLEVLECFWFANQLLSSQKQKQKQKNGYRHGSSVFETYQFVDLNGFSVKIEADSELCDDTYENEEANITMTRPKAAITTTTTPTTSKSQPKKGKYKNNKEESGEEFEVIFSNTGFSPKHLDPSLYGSSVPYAMFAAIVKQCANDIMSNVIDRS